MEEYDYEGGLKICLKLLEADFDDWEAHILMLSTFHTLGLKNRLVTKVRQDLKQIMTGHGSSL